MTPRKTVLYIGQLLVRILNLMLFFRGIEHTMVAAKDSSGLDVEIRHKHNQLVIHLICNHGRARIETRDHGRACMLCASPRVPVCLKEKHNARKAVWFTTATVIGAISAFVDNIDSHIILRMIRESKTDIYVQSQLTRLETSRRFGLF